LNFDVKKYVIDEKASVKSALLKVEKNSFGMIFAQTNAGKIVGLATDGDIRRALIRGVTLEDEISNCMNRKFVWAATDTPREQLIKRLDGHIHLIPILDEQGKLSSIISKDYLPLEDEKSVYIRARAPVRVSFGGGGSDLTHYFENSSGAVINTAVSIYSHGTMRVRDDSKIIISSLDLGETLTANNIEEALLKKGPFGLVQSLMHVVQPKYGFELSLNSDFPLGSGLGGSATLSAVILGCFNMLRRDKWNQHELAEIAFQAERLHLGIAGGWQDQYAAVFGGFNFIEFYPEENIVSPIRLQSDISLELEESLVLCDTGIAHHSGNIHDNQKQTMKSDDVQKLVKKNVELTHSTRKYLLKGDLVKFGECLDTAWKLKRNFSDMISNDYIDAVYEGALENGALGGKLLGAGGGGFFIFYVPPFKKNMLISYLKTKNLTIQPFRFEPDGLKTWTSREHEKHSIERQQVS
jgi:D-glycero-alpha-D-manno-heptose-7-phosphate kinase